MTDEHDKVNNSLENLKEALMKIEEDAKKYDENLDQIERNHKVSDKSLQAVTLL